VCTSSVLKLTERGCTYPAHGDHDHQPTQCATNVPIVGPPERCAKGEDDPRRGHHQNKSYLGKGRSGLAMNVLGRTEEEHGKRGKDAAIAEG
jgi:hypothetical protein